MDEVGICCGETHPRGREDDASRAKRRDSRRVALLNTFNLWVRDETVELPLPVQRVLAFLALQPGPVRRIHIAGTLWLNATQAHADGSLRSALWRLRGLGVPIIEPHGDRIGLAEDVDIDVRETIAWARQVLRGDAPVVEGDAERIADGGELLPGWDEDWVSFERERIRQLLVHAGEEISRRLLVAGRLGAAIEVALAVVRDEPFRESSRRVLIEAHLSQGNRAEAVRQYQSFRRVLADEVGLEPSRELEQLALGVRLTAQ